MNKKNQILFAVLIIMALFYFISGMLLPVHAPLWHRAIGLLVIIGWGILILSIWKSKQKK